MFEEHFVVGWKSVCHLVTMCFVFFHPFFQLGRRYPSVFYVVWMQVESVGPFPFFFFFTFWVSFHHVTDHPTDCERQKEKKKSFFLGFPLFSLSGVGFSLFKFFLFFSLFIIRKKREREKKKRKKKKKNSYKKPSWLRLFLYFIIFIFFFWLCSNVSLFIFIFFFDPKENPDRSFFHFYLECAVGVPSTQWQNSRERKREKFSSP